MRRGTGITHCSSGSAFIAGGTVGRMHPKPAASFLRRAPQTTATIERGGPGHSQPGSRVSKAGRCCMVHSRPTLTQAGGYYWGTYVARFRRRFGALLSPCRSRRSPRVWRDFPRTALRRWRAYKTITSRRCRATARSPCAMCMSLRQIIGANPIVRVAPPTRYHGLVAAADRTYTGISH